MPLPSATSTKHTPRVRAGRALRARAGVAGMQRRLGDGGGGHEGGRGPTGWAVGRVGACAGACVRVDLPGWCARRAPGAAECVVGTVGSTCGVLAPAVTAQGTYIPGGTQKPVVDSHPGGGYRPRARRSRPPAPAPPARATRSCPLGAVPEPRCGLARAARPRDTHREAHRSRGSASPSAGRAPPSSFGACRTRFGTNRQGRRRRGACRRCEARFTT